MDTKVCSVGNINVKSHEGHEIPDGPRGVDCGHYSMAEFAAPAVFDPCRFQKIAFRAVVATASPLTLTIPDQEVVAFQEGIGEAGTLAGTAPLVAAQTEAWTNVESGGYLVPPQAEGKITALGVRPSGIFYVPLGGPRYFFDNPAFEDTLSQYLAESVSMRPEFFDVTGRQEDRTLGNMARWPCFGGVRASHFDTESEYKGGISKLRPLQYSIFTGGPDVSRNQRQDRFLLRMRHHGTQDLSLLVQPSLLASGFTVGDVLYVVFNVEIAVDLVNSEQGRVDAAQDTSIAALQRQIAELNARIAKMSG